MFLVTTTRACPTAPPARPSRRGPLERTVPAVLLLALLCGCLFFYGLNAGELYRTESLRAIIAAEFLRSGNWVVPTLYGEPLFTKPPGMYAAIALASWPFGGVREWTARLPSALAATALVFLFYSYFRRQLGRLSGLVAAVVLPTSLMWLDKAPSAEIDMLQVAWVAGGIVCFLLALEASESGCAPDKVTRRQGDRVTRRQGDKVTRDGNTLGCGSDAEAPPRASDHPLPLSPCHPVTLSPCHPVTLSPCHPLTLSPPPPLRHSAALYWLASLLCVAGGVLTKWTAPAFFYGTVIPLLWWRGRLRLLWGWPHLLAAATGAGVCLAWAAWAVWLTGWETFYTTVSQEALQRLSPRHHIRPYPWGETLAHPFVILAASLPWSAFALLTLRPGFAALWDERGRRLLQALHCWTWPNLLFWSVLPEHAPRHSFPLQPGLAGLAAMVWTAWLTGRLRMPAWLERLRPGRVLVGLLLAWLVVKVVFVEVVIPIRSGQREPRAKAELIAAHVPAGQVLYLFRLKDEGIMFYYGRPVRRLAGPGQLPSSPEPLYCILEDSEWRQWQAARLAEALVRLTDEQGAPIVLVRVMGEPRPQAVSASMIPPGTKVLSVSEITLAVKGMLQDAFRSVWVTGEIGNWKPATSGHVYPTLKEKDQAQLKAVIWRTTLQRLPFKLYDGLEVIAHGRLDVYPPHGEYRLVIDEIQPKGIGAQELALRQLKEKLNKLGYFDPARKRPLPAFPRRLALLTSPAGAAVRDMLQVLCSRWRGTEIWVCPVRVQGEGAAESIADMVRQVNQLHASGVLPFDVLILGRGGGSGTDLWAFNGECVAHAIFASRIPVVSAVGHEIDVTLADLVADRRAITPTEAATLVVPDGEECLRELSELEARLRKGLLLRLDLAKQRLNDLAERRIFRLPLERVREHEQRLDDWAERLRRAARQRLALAHNRLEAQAARLESLSPLNVLARGYSLTRRETDLAVVREPEQVAPGDRLITHVQRGRIISRVERLEPADGTVS